MARRSTWRCDSANDAPHQNVERILAVHERRGKYCVPQTTEGTQKREPKDLRYPRSLLRKSASRLTLETETAEETETSINTETTGETEKNSSYSVCSVTSV